MSLEEQDPLHIKRANLVRRIIVLFAAVAVITSAWFIPEFFNENGSSEEAKQSKSIPAKIIEAITDDKDDEEEETAETQGKAGIASSIKNIKTLLKGQPPEVKTADSRKPPGDELAPLEDGPLLDVIHYHLPGNPASDRIAACLADLSPRYEARVRIRTRDLAAEQELAKHASLADPPYIVMLVEDRQMFSRQGGFPKPKLVGKIDQILHGLKAIGKDWRPDVPGMERTSSATLTP